MFKETYSLIHKANQGAVGDKKYFIGAWWWQAWCDYVNFDIMSSRQKIVNNPEMTGEDRLMSQNSLSGIK